MKSSPSSSSTAQAPAPAPFDLPGHQWDARTRRFYAIDASPPARMVAMSAGLDPAESPPTRATPPSRAKKSTLVLHQALTTRGIGAEELARFAVRRALSVTPVIEPLPGSLRPRRMSLADGDDVPRVTALSTTTTAGDLVDLIVTYGALELSIIESPSLNHFHISRLVRGNTTIAFDAAGSGALATITPVATSRSVADVWIDGRIMQSSENVPTEAMSAAFAGIDIMVLAASGANGVVLDGRTLLPKARICPQSSDILTATSWCRYGSNSILVGRRDGVVAILDPRNSAVPPQQHTVCVMENSPVAWIESSGEHDVVVHAPLIDHATSVWDLRTSRRPRFVLEVSSKCCPGLPAHCSSHGILAVPGRSLDATCAVFSLDNGEALGRVAVAADPGGPVALRTTRPGEANDTVLEAWSIGDDSAQWIRSRYPL